MKKEDFYDNLKKVYTLLKNRQDKINSYYDVLQEGSSCKNKKKRIDDFLDQISLEKSRENRLAAITRLVNLRDDSLVQAMKQENFSEKRILEVKEEAYLWVADFYLKEHKKLIKKIEKDSLLDKFYIQVLKGVHDVGSAFSSWQSSWTAQIINGTNRDLYRDFNGDEEKIYEMLNYNDLFEKDEQGEKADRSYSVLRKGKKGFETITYFKAFKKEVNKVVSKLEDFYCDLEPLKDDTFNQKENHLIYIKSIIKALREKDSKKLIKRWADVDRKWMKLTTPLQIGHPLEYYEDRYRKAVALEWDLRIANPERGEADTTLKHIKSMYKDIFENNKKGKKYQKIYQNSLENLSKIQLYIGRPALFYGAEFCGLFSAQVVPNDETVSAEEGKKVFAFADNILSSLRAKPFLKIQREVFGEEFLNKERELIFKKESLWHKVYEITTIGHEFGHILWMDENSETLMNKSGNFKNIEEFKATTGGLAAFFMNEDNEVKDYVLSDTIKRVVGLIAWMETNEVEPYYCEGLIHLHGLFETGVLDFKEKLTIDTSHDAYERIKKWYLKTYSELAEHYLDKKDASDFLYKYAKKENGYYLPVDGRVKYFVKYYWNLHKEIGMVLDDTSDKEEWV